MQHCSDLCQQLSNANELHRVQGLTELQLSPQLLRQLLADIADNAAFGSMVMGELPGLPLQMAEVSSPRTAHLPLSKQNKLPGAIAHAS